MNRVLFFVAVLFVLLTVIIFGGLTSDLSSLSQATSDGQELIEDLSLEENSQSDFDELEVLKELEETGTTAETDLANAYYHVKLSLDSTHADVVGWIRIHQLGISYPVMYNASDNNWYLKHAWTGEESKWGCISMDIQNEGHWGPHTLLNGHNMKDDSMFGRLPELMNEEVFNSLEPIEVFDGRGLRTYQVFSVFSVNGKEESLHLSGTSIQDFRNKLREYQERSLFYRELPSNASEALILNTCWYGSSGFERNLHCIVVAYRLS